MRVRGATHTLGVLFGYTIVYGAPTLVGFHACSHIGTLRLKGRVGFRIPRTRRHKLSDMCGHALACTWWLLIPSVSALISSVFATAHAGLLAYHFFDRHTCREALGISSQVREEQRRTPVAAFCYSGSALVMMPKAAVAGGFLLKIVGSLVLKIE